MVGLNRKLRSGITVVLKSLACDGNADSEALDIAQELKCFSHMGIAIVRNARSAEVILSNLAEWSTWILNLDSI
jgi:hypothetical protein